MVKILKLRLPQFANKIQDMKLNLLHEQQILCYVSVSKVFGHVAVRGKKRAQSAENTLCYFLVVSFLLPIVTLKS